MSVEREILRRIHESREISTYKGYRIGEDSEGYIFVMKNGKKLAEFENEHEAFDYIDNATHHDHINRSVVNYCIQAVFQGSSQVYYLCLDKFRRSVAVTKDNVMLYATKKEALKVADAIWQKSNNMESCTAVRWH